VASRDKKAFLLRIDPDLWGELERLAAAELRSVNAQVEFMLREAMTTRGVRSKTARKTRPSRDD
jgi:hypothetical protein